MAGVFCAAGMLTADVEHDLLRTVLKRLDRVPPGKLQRIADELRADGLVTLAAEGYSAEAVSFELKADLRYVGQSSELAVRLRGDTLDAAALEALRGDFQKAYLDTFGYSSEEPLELVNLRMAVRGHRPNRLAFDSVRLEESAVAGSSGTRRVSFERDAPLLDTPVVARSDVGTGFRDGPLIVESYDTTAVVPPGARVRADAIGNLIVEIDA